MEAKALEAKTLQQAVIHFQSFENCKAFMVKMRWPDGVVRCPRCDSEHVKFLAKAKVWKCYGKHDHAKFSLKTGTIFEESPLGLDKWLVVVWLIVNAKNGISSWEIHRAMGVTQKTAWFMLHRVRLAMQDDLTGGMLGGEVEVDETYIGGKGRNMHKARKEKILKNGGYQLNKAVVIGMLERREGQGKNGSRIRATVVPDTKIDTMQETVLGHVKQGAHLYSDEAGKRWEMPNEFNEHEFINHLESYVEGNVHTNGIENFWALLKRGLGGTYVSVEPFHLFRYVDEQAFRFNNRIGMNDGDRFVVAMQQIVGKRLTYKELTGKEAVPTDEEPF